MTGVAAALMLAAFASGALADAGGARDGGHADAGAASGADASGATAVRAAPSVQPSASANLFIGSFPVENHLGRSLFDGAGARVTLRFDPAQARASNELVRRRRIAIDAAGNLQLTKLGYPPTAPSDRPTRQQQRPSFLIDYDVPAFAPAWEAARAQLGSSPSIDQLVHFVDRYIDKKGFERGYDIASVVARRREGDCTEHAVLLTALARASRIPARVAEGLVLLEVEGRVVAFGHAWVEVYRGGAWRPADAALSGPQPRIYLPLEITTDEGPGFAFAMTQTGAGTIGVRRVIISPLDR